MNHQFNFNLFKDLQLSSPSTGKFPCFKMLGLARPLVPCSLKAPLYHRVIISVRYTNSHTHTYTHPKPNTTLQMPPLTTKETPDPSPYFSKLHSLMTLLTHSQILLLLSGLNFISKQNKSKWSGKITHNFKPCKSNCVSFLSDFLRSFLNFSVHKYPRVLERSG